MNMRASFAHAGTYTPGTLIARNADLIIGRKVTIASGSNLLRGSVLGQITDGGKFVLSTAAAEDGSQTPTAVLAEDTDASEGDATGLAYVRGYFIAPSMILGAGHTIDTITPALRGNGISLFSAMT